MNVSDDQSLVRQCLEGNSRAFETIVEKYQKPLYNVAYRYLQNKDDAEDVTQAVFVKVFEKLSSYKTDFKFFSWIYKIAINEAINFREARKPVQALDENVISSIHTPDGMYLDGELHGQIKRALGEIQIDYRMVIVLKHFQDCSYQEMSEILDIPVKTVKSRLFSARQQLKDILGKHQHDR